MILNMSGGGAALNFRVVGGTTVPENPMENTIWINTATKITSWIFSAEAPSSAEEGMVWISVGSSSSIAFSATKKNPIMVYPISAKQYISNAWTDVKAKSYRSNAWVDWFDGILFNKGNQCESVTGGWVEANGNPINSSSGTMTTQAWQTSSFSSGLCTAKQIDISGYTKLCVNVTDFAKNGFIGLSKTLTNNPQTIDGKSAFAYVSATGIATLDISEFAPGKYHIVIAAGASNGTVYTVATDKVWLE